MAFTKINAAGIGTTERATVDGLTVINNLSVGGTVSIAGTLTYEDVTNVDSVGLITARNGIVVGSGITLSKDGDIFATGITTVSGNVKVGTGITLSPDGNLFATGVSTFRGELRLTEGTSSTSNGDEIGSLMYLHPATNNTNAKIVALQNGGSSGADLAFFTRTQADATNNDGGEERLRIDSNGDVVVNDTSAAGNVHPDTKFHVKGGITFRELTSASEGALPAITQWSSSGTGQDLAIGSRSNNGAVIFFTGNAATDGDWGDSSNAERLRISADGTVSLVNDSNLQIPDKIIHSGDTDTTIRFPADDVIAFETAGTERFRITGTGNVGVSTGNPTGRFSVGKVGAYLNRDGITVTNPHSSGLKNGVFVLNESGYNNTATYRAAAFKAVGTSGFAIGISTDQGSNGLGGTLNYSVNFDGKSNQDGSITANGSFYQEDSSTTGDDTQDKTIEFNRRGIFLMLISYSLGTTTTDVNRNVYSLGLFTSRSNGATWTAIQQDLTSTHVGNLTISDASSRGKLRVQKSSGSDNRTCAFRIDVLSSADVAITVTDT